MATGDSLNEGFLEQIRRAELESVKDLFSAGMKVLELGGGSGFQARILSSWGCDVVSIDLPERRPAHATYFPVQDYDGKDISFPDSTFDVVFSSNVLEHASNLPGMLAEIRRVGKPSGISLHILPSPTWRFWTMLTHYVYAVRWLVGTQPRVPGIVEPVPVREVARQHGIASVIKQLLMAGPHGEYPNAFSELYFFSRYRWRRLFESNHFRVRAIRNCGIYQSGYTILPSLTLPRRRQLARWLGSSSFAVIAEAVKL